MKEYQVIGRNIRLIYSRDESLHFDAPVVDAGRIIGFRFMRYNDGLSSKHTVAMSDRGTQWEWA